MLNTPTYFRLFSIFILVAAAYFIQGCDNDPPTEPGDNTIPISDPTPVPATSAPTQVPRANPMPSPPPTGVPAEPDWSYTRKLPAVLPCTTQYEVEANVKQAVTSCTGVNYQSLYTRARQITQIRTQSQACPANCSPPHSWETARKWGCSQFPFPPPPPGAPRSQAFAAVKRAVSCPAPQDPRPTDAAFTPPNPSWTQPYNPPGFPSAQPGDLIIEDSSATGPVPLTCPTRKTERVKYFENVPSCPPQDFRPFIQRARSAAMLQRASQTCPQPCSYTQFSVLQSFWDCVGTLVNVDIIYDLDCRRP